MTTVKVDVYQKITDLFIQTIEQGISPWNKTWSVGNVQPQNYFSKKAYRGINAFILGCSPSGLPYFCTFKQVVTNGGSIKKGAKSLPVVYWNVVDSKKDFHTDENGNVTPDKVFFIKYYNVFNISDVEGIEFNIPEIKLSDNQKLLNCESVVSNMKNAPKIVHENLVSAFYHPYQDYVNMPRIGQFVNSEYYYSTLFHELVHSTGHQIRLNREGITAVAAFGSQIYSKEELVAEMGAAFLCNNCGILAPDLVTNTAAYLKGWLSKLKDDKKFIFWAAKEAQKAVQYIMPEHQDEDTAEDE